MPSDFNTAQYFVVGHDNGTGNRILFKQNGPCSVTYGGPKTITWSVNTAVLAGASGPVPMAFLTGNGLFTLSGAGVAGTVDLDLDVLDAMATNPAPQPTARLRVLEAFINGGLLTLGVSADGAADESLFIRLRALKCADFLLGSGAAPEVARVAHHPGVSGNLISFPDVVNNATGEPSSGGTASPDGNPDDAAGDYTCTLSDGSGYSVAGITLTSEGHLTLDPTDDPPPPGSSGALTLTLTHTPTGQSSTLPVEVHLPTDVVVLLDRSGSMGASVGPASNKWDIASDVGSLFSLLLGTMLPERTIVGGSFATLAEHYRTAIGRFHWSGGGEVIPITAFAAASTTPVVAPDSPGGTTPIGMALEDAADVFTPSRWTRRQVVLLTDGMDNTGSPRLHELTSAEFPALSDDAATGIVLHNVSYARTGDVPVAALSALVTGHDGTFDSTETDPAGGLSAEALRAAFLNPLHDIGPFGMAGPVNAGSPHAVEDGVERLLLVATAEGAGLGATRDGAPVAGTTGSGHGYSWIRIDDPAPGDYVATAVPAGAAVYAFYDLSLRARFGVDAPGQGQPIRLWAELRHHGVPIRGADIRTAGHLPAESTGELLTTSARQGLFLTAVRKKLLDVDALVASRAAASGGSAGRVDPLAVRRILNDAVRGIRGSGVKYTREALVLSEVTPGRYEAELPATLTQNEDVYTFEFRASGTTPSGHRFTRDRRLSVVLAPVVDSNASDTSLVNVAPAGTPGRWIATVVPRTVTGHALGPGLVPELAFEYLDPADRQRLPPLPIVDHLDGSYQTRLDTEPQKVPKFGLFWRPNPERGPIIVRPACPRVRQVSVRLDKLQLLDDHDPFLLGSGEIVLHTRVAPNGSPSRTVSMRLPAQGHYSASNANLIEVDEVIFTGLVEQGALLVMGITGKELDWPQCFDHQDELGRYLRRLRLPEETLRMTPDDEPNDPESLHDWKVWYTVEIG